MLVIDVSEIHAYPLRPEGFEEPLFSTADSKRESAEHLLKVPWLSRASELEGRTGGAARVLEEPIELRSFFGRVDVVRLAGGRRGCLEEVLDRWREVRGWWDEDRHVDRMVFRVLLSGGAVVDLTRERSGEWLLVGLVD